MFDHSCGHDKKSADGLIVESMAKYYGGKQETMQDATIGDLHGYLGPYKSILKVGDHQKMNFQHYDMGPFLDVT